MPVDLSFLTPGGALGGALFADLVREQESPLVAGDRLGVFVLTREIGRGGHGVVWLAERCDEAFAQTVAIKVVKAGANLRARFLRERNVLGRLQHPHIARIVDAGERDDGTLWYAMEYVEGERADRYLTTGINWRGRIRLIIAIAAAVEHAHRHLVIHGDLTPGNVIVADDGLPRLLDFGIARRLDDGGNDDEIVFTPGYASPEQRAGEPLTTASDIFQLGGLLQRWVMDAGSVRPPGWAATSLRRIAARALERIPSDRYAHVSELRSDLDCVLAMRPALGVANPYTSRVAMFFGRHARMLTLGATLVALLGVIGIQNLSRMAESRARLAQETARSREVSAFLTGLFRAANPNESGGKTIDAAEILRRGAQRIERDLGGQPQLVADLSSAIGEAYLQLGALASAEPLLDRAIALRDVAEPRALARTLELQALLRHRQGRFAEALGIVDQAMTLTEHFEDATLQADLGNRRGLILKALGRLDESLDQFDQALKHAERVAPDADVVARVLNNRGLALMQIDRNAQARASFERALAIYATRYGDDHPLWSGTAANLSWLLGEMHEFAAARDLIERRLRVSEEIYGAQSAEYANDLNILGGIFADEGKAREAIAVFERSATIWQAALGEDHPAPMHPVHNIGKQLLGLGEHAAALSRLERVYERRLRLLGPVHMEVAEVELDLGDALMALGRTAQAKSMYEIAHAAYASASRRPHRGVGDALARLGAVASKLGNVEEARRLYRLAHASYLEVLGASDPATLGMLDRIAALPAADANT